jgi:UDP-N-acetylglucosamine 2-epimerase (non-hydrolysing)
VAEPTAAPGEQRLLVTCHRRENWGTAFLPIAHALHRLASAPPRRIDVVLHPNPAQADTMRRLLAGSRAIHLLEPLDHPAMIAAMAGTTLMLSDSGGVQEEAPYLGLPLLVLREKTERPEGIATGNPEGIATGNMLLVGTATDRIVAEAERLLTDEQALAAMSRPAMPYGDGFAAPRIAALIAAWLSERDWSPERLIA